MVEPLADLFLPYPPSVNHLWLPVPFYNARLRKWQAKLVLSPQGKAYQDEAFWMLKSQRTRQSQWPITGLLVSTIFIAPPDAARRDKDNLIKALWDSLTTAMVINDDSQIQELHLYSEPPVRQGSVRVLLGAYPGLVPA